MKSYFRENDGLVTQPQFTYKKGKAFGTSLGGCCTMCGTIFICTYMVIMAFGFFSERNYSVSNITDYQPILDPETYTISTSSDVLPAM